MKVALVARATLFSSPGGDTTQVEQTAAGLRRLGVDAQVFTTDQRIPYQDFQLLHFFNIIRPADILAHTARTTVPYVVSTIFVDYGDFERQTQHGLRGWLHRLAGDDGMEYIKAIARWIKNGERIRSLRYMAFGHRAAVRRVALGARLLLPNSNSENSRFVEKYGVSRPYHVVPNGINEQLARSTTNASDQGQRTTVMCAGRIEARKNQLGLIHALHGSDYPLLIVGKPSPNNLGYFEQCQAAAGPNVRFFPWLSEAALYQAYQSARVHVLPSYFETTGLSSLEAAVMGCNVVVSPNGDTRDYFGAHAWYCRPDDVTSIRKAVDEAFTAPYDPAFREIILRDYTWDRAASETLAAYQKIL